MDNPEESRHHAFKHVPTGRFLEHWIDGWYLTDDRTDATIYMDEDYSTTKIIPMLEILFGGVVVMVFETPDEPTTRHEPNGQQAATV
ncbi:hypothetical protein HQ571_05945 [Candidatus Kuenenbacteria bacterium]|nr:hypothetical protein [Candidatus Kuenenbacteria bacterium]